MIKRRGQVKYGQSRAKHCSAYNIASVPPIGGADDEKGDPCQRCRKSNAVTDAVGDFLTPGLGDSPHAILTHFSPASYSLVVAVCWVPDPAAMGDQ